MYTDVTEATPTSIHVRMRSRISARDIPYKSSDRPHLRSDFSEANRNLSEFYVSGSGEVRFEIIQEF